MTNPIAKHVLYEAGFRHPGHTEFLAALAAAPAPATVLEYEGDRGPMLQHVGPLVTRAAHEKLWPKILDWLAERWAESA